MASTISALTSGGGIALSGDTSGALQLQTNNGTTAVTVDTSQNVGIGTSSPSDKLDVAGNIVIGSGNQYKFGTGGVRIVGNTTSNYMAFLTNSGTEQMRIDSSGNVGIGTSSPAQKLQVVNTSAGATTTPILIQNRGNAANTKVQIAFIATGSDWSDGQYAAIQGISGGAGGTANSLGFITSPSGGSPTERMRIDSSGNVGIGITSFSTIAPLTVATASINPNYGQITAYSVTTGDVARTGMSVVKYDNNTTTSQILFKFLINQGANGSGQINANGANACAFGTYSDERLKENITLLSPQLDNILALKPSEFDYIESEGGGHQIGFIAQEMQKVYPDSVGERGDGMLTISGWDKTTARLVKAIQEQQAIIEQLKADVEALKGASV